MSEDRGARHAIDQHTKQINGLAKAINNAAIAQQNRDAEANQRKAVDLLSEIQGKLIDRSAAYTNLMLLGGYAGLFTIWSRTASALSLKANILVASSTGISLTVFIAFEIYKMIFTGKRFLKNRAFLTESMPPDQFAKKLQEMQQYESRIPLSYMRLWIATIAVCLTTALFAIGLLGYNYFALLVDWPTWPRDQVRSFII